MAWRAKERGEANGRAAAMIFRDKEMTLDAKIDRLEFRVVVAC